MRRETYDCQRCGATVVIPGGDEEAYPSLVCPSCARLLPEALCKALVDPFDYAIGLCDGGTIRFEHAAITGDFVHLREVRCWAGLTTCERFTFDRGVDIRLSDIVWACDAPQGS